VGRNATAGTLVIVETTVPPGTTEHVVVPTLAEELTARGIDPQQVLVAHSYERVMPGADYFDSIVNFWRVFAGHDEAAAKAAEAFLRTVINTSDFPLTRLSHTTASETAKVLENTYRATTIALMEEWARFAERAGIDLFEIVDAIRLRPTHSNIRTPGFGVGGYCLTKDPLFARLGAREFFDAEMDFSFSSAAVATNKESPLASLDRLQTMMGGDLADRRILLLGISYRQDVGDTRYSPSETFVRSARARGADVLAYDPLVRHWDELACDTPESLPASDGFDAVVFAVPHDEFRSLDLRAWLGDNRPTLLDAFGVLTPDQRNVAVAQGCVVAATGRGDTPS
jgi:nucleotide sugar dehydrogenase